MISVMLQISKCISPLAHSGS